MVSFTDMRRRFRNGFFKFSGSYSFVKVLFDFGYKAITPTRHGFDEPRLMGVIIQRPPQHFDIKGEVAFLDRTVVPDFLHQLVFWQQPSGVFDKDLKSFKDLRGEWNRPVFTKQG